MLTNLTNRSFLQDRFIHNRQNCKQNLFASPSDEKSSEKSLYQHLIKNNLFNTQDNISSFSSQQTLASAEEYINNKQFVSKLQAKVNSPVKILDVPMYKDDFYLNNIDWSQNGPIGIALNNEVFIYTPQNLQQIKTDIFNCGTHVTGLKIQDQLISVGHSNGTVELFDIQIGQRIRKLEHHSGRVSSLMFMDSLLVSGGKDKQILVHDLRLKDHVVKIFNKHKGEICTMKAKNKTEKIFASGSVDGSAIIWDLKFGFVDQLKAHNGAVKALDWCPWKNGILATGGGNNSDKSIKVWNTTNSALLSKQSIKSQISGLVWNSELNMMISSHGYSDNDLKFWSLDSNSSDTCKLTKRKEFNAHSARILSLQQSHDQSYLCTVGADQTLNFWYLFQTQNTNPFHRETSRTPHGSPFRL